MRPCEHAAEVPLISDPGTAHCVDLFNVTYEILLLMLDRFFAHTEETDEQLQTLADAAVAVMLRVLRPLGSLITTLPAGPQHPGRTAGPSFELFYERLPHAAPGGRLGAARGAAAGGRGVLRTRAQRHRPGTGRTAGSGRGVPQRHRRRVGGAVRGLGGGQPLLRTWPGCHDAVPRDVLDRARDLYEVLPEAATGPVVDLFHGAMGVLEGLATDPPPAGAARVGARLVNSMLRPLGEALAGVSSSLPSRVFPRSRKQTRSGSSRWRPPGCGSCCPAPPAAARP